MLYVYSKIRVAWINVLVAVHPVEEQEKSVPL